MLHKAINQYPFGSSQSRTKWKGSQGRSEEGGAPQMDKTLAIPVVLYWYEGTPVWGWDRIDKPEIG